MSPKPDEPSQSQTDPKSTDTSGSRVVALSTLDEMLRIWTEGIVILEPRYGYKGLLKLVAVAAVNEEFRLKLIDDPRRALADMTSMAELLPAGLQLNFYENTPDVLHVVLPPFVGESKNPSDDLRARISRRRSSSTLRERLHSRTDTAGASLFSDDFDIGDWDDLPNGTVDHGDPGTRDGGSDVPTT
jgi:hypothetical protein